MAHISMEDLDRITERVRKAAQLRDGTGHVRVTVHMGTCGIAAGARKIMNTLLDGITRREAAGVVLTTTGCAGLCSSEPMITVETEGQAPVKYGNLDEAKTERILEEHILNDRPVAEFAIGRGSERQS